MRSAVPAPKSLWNAPVKCTTGPGLPARAVDGPRDRLRHRLVLDALGPVIAIGAGALLRRWRAARLAVAGRRVVVHRLGEPLEVGVVRALELRGHQRPVGRRQLLDRRLPRSSRRPTRTAAARWRPRPASLRSSPIRRAAGSRSRSAARAGLLQELLGSAIAPDEVAVERAPARRARTSRATPSARRAGAAGRTPARCSSRCVFGSSCCSPTKTTSACARSATIDLEVGERAAARVVDALRHVVRRPVAAPLRPAATSEAARSECRIMLVGPTSRSRRSAAGSFGCSVRADGPASWPCAAGG